MDQNTDSSLPMVSVCVPLYNHEYYIEALLESVKADPYPSKELIVIDDGSIDSSFERLTAWQKAAQPNFVCIFIRQENQGVSRTLNYLMEKASGDYCVLVASDDLLVKGGIEKRVSFLENHPNLVAVFGDAMVVSEDGTVIMPSALEGLYGADKRKYISQSSLHFQIVVRWSVPGPVLMVRRKGFLAMGGFTTQIKLEDYDFYLRLSDQNKLGFIDEIVAGYRIHDTNLSRSRDAGRFIRIEILKTCIMNFRKTRLRTKIYLVARMGITLIRWFTWEIKKCY